MRKSFSLTVKILVSALFVIPLLFAVSCKKTSPQLPTEGSGQQAADVNKTASRQASGEISGGKSDANSPGKTAVTTVTPTADTNTSDVNHPAGWVPIEIKLPKPMFVGTPQDTRVPNLEKPLGRMRLPFYAPAGTKNVALDKPVSSSDEEPIIGEIKMITDGDKEAADGSYAELGPRMQYVTIDLQAACEIYAIVVWHYHKQARVYYDVVVQVADDPDFITNVRTLFNNDIDNTSGLGVGKNMHYTETNEGKLIDAKGTRAHYVRLYSNGNTGNDLNHYIEVEVYGKPVE